MKPSNPWLWSGLAALAGGVLATCAGPTDRPEPGGPWRDLFDGRTLAGWHRSGFEGEGAVAVNPQFEDGRPAIVIEAGTTLSGITWREGSRLPRTNYELTLEARRIAGADFFCGLTFPVGTAACTLIVGGWGGVVVGLSNIDRMDASQNETSREMDFEDGRWYRIRLRVTEARIEAWIDVEKVVDLATGGRTFSLRPGDIQRSLPLGVATYMTRAAIRGIRLREIPRAVPPDSGPARESVHSPRVKS